MMGRLLNEEQLIKNNVDKYIERSSSEYSKYLESTPTFVTYYHRNALGSTYDRGLENVEKDIGKDSPNKFNRIEKFPLYGIDGLSLSLNREDFGMDTEYDGDATIIPNTVIPYPDDFFTIDYVGEVYLFKITNVANDAIKSKPYYKVNFSFSKKLDDARDINEQVEENYILLFNNIGTDNRPIVKKNDFILVDYIDNLYEKLYKTFIRDFYDGKLNVVTFETNGYKLYNRYLNKFIMESGLFKKDYDYMSSIYLVDAMQENIAFWEMYRSTIYNALQKQDISELTGEFIFPTPINDIHTPFAQYSVSYNTVNFVEKLDNRLFDYFPVSFIPRIKIDNKFTDGKHDVENAVIDYLYKRLEPSVELFDMINKQSFYPDMFSYVFLPILMYILKDLRNKLLRTN
jgi:hypothetical protein